MSDLDQMFVPASASPIRSSAQPTLSVWLGLIIGLTPASSIALYAAVAFAFVARTRMILLVAAAVVAYASRPFADIWLDRFGGWLLANRGYRPLWLGLMEQPLSLHLQWYNSVTLAVLVSGLLALPAALIADAALAVLRRPRALPRERAIEKLEPTLGEHSTRSDEGCIDDREPQQLAQRVEGLHQITAPQLFHRRPSRSALVEASMVEVSTVVASAVEASMIGASMIDAATIEASTVEDRLETDCSHADAIRTDQPRLQGKFVVKETIIEILRFHNRRPAAGVEQTAQPPASRAVGDAAADAKGTLAARATSSEMVAPRNVSEAVRDSCPRPSAGGEALPYLLSHLSGNTRSKAAEEA